MRFSKPILFCGYAFLKKIGFYNLSLLFIFEYIFHTIVYFYGCGVVESHLEVDPIDMCEKKD